MIFHVAQSPRVYFTERDALWERELYQDQATMLKYPIYYSKSTVNYYKSIHRDFFAYVSSVK
jgi:hypothetical protein